ncbi:hypothetical protein EIP86_008258 [Pleurotus ostreatoroseus]|nr:hypothetical protein EIP86_008258 [Pleurotus ostreatoroseus]
MPSPSIIVSQPSPSADHAPDEHDFSRRLRISPASPRRAEHSSPRAQQGRLYNPNTDGVRPRPVVAEPDAMSDAASSAYAPRGSVHLPRRSQPVRTSGDPPRLFDPRKDNPHQFNVLQRPSSLSNGTATAAPSGGMRQTPTPKSSGDWVSASSTSSASYAHSTISSNFTLSSTATDSSTGSALFDNKTPRSEDSAGPSALSSQLKRLYREILSLEARVQCEDRDRDMVEETDRGAHPQRVRVLTTAGAVGEEAKDVDEEVVKEKLKRLVQDHKDLVELIYRMLSLTLAPTVPQSLKSIPVKYNLVFRLWNHGFHRLLERLRHYAMANSKVSLEHLQEFTYYAYSFYTYLIKEQLMAGLHAAWVESLGDITRYCIAVSSMLEKSVQNAGGPAAAAHTHAITAAKLCDNHLLLTLAANAPEGRYVRALGQECAAHARRCCRHAALTLYTVAAIWHVCEHVRAVCRA